MSTQIQRRRGTTVQHSSFTGAAGETTIDTDKEVVVVHDGVQVGGYPQMRENGSNSALALGSAGTPSLKFTGDTNTGIYSPGADQVAISTNGTGRLFVNSSGEVSVAGSNIVASAANRGNFTINGTSSSLLGFYNNSLSKGWIFHNGTDLQLNNQASGSLVFTNNGSDRLFITSTGTLNFVGAGIANVTQAVSFNGSAPANSLVIDSSGRLGLGTSSPGSVLDVRFGTNPANDNGGAANVLRVLTTVSSAADVGGAIALGGKATGTSDDVGFGQIAGRKTNATSGNYAGYLQFSTLGSAGTMTERMRITDTGNVGIGTTSPLSPLVVSNGSNKNIELQPGSTCYLIAYDRTAGDYLDLDIEAENVTFSTNNGLEKARIDSSGRLLVGTSTSFGGGYGAANLQVSGPLNGDPAEISLRRNYAGLNASGMGAIAFYSPEGRIAQISANTDGTQTAGTASPGALVFSTTAAGASSPTERMRISSAGTVNVFSSDQGFNSRIAATSATNEDIFIGRHSATSTSSGTISFLVKASGNVQNTNNSYGAISDLKLKENIVDASSQWGDLKSLRVVKYNLKPETNQGTHTQIGLIAQEVELVSPGLVSESPDRDADGNDLGTVTKSVNYSVLYMKAVKALQEAMERIEALEQRLADAGIA